MNHNSHKTLISPSPPQLDLDDENEWDKPFSIQDLDAIDAAILSFSSSSSVDCNDTVDDPNTRPKTRRRLPHSMLSSNSHLGSGQKFGSFSLQPCSSFRPNGSVKMKYHEMKFGGQIVYSQTVNEVEEAALQIRKLLETKKRDSRHCVLGVDVEWKPSFEQGIPQGKAAVMQICGDMNHCYVLHIFHSGIPLSLQSILEDPIFIKVGVGIDNDSVKVFHDHNVSIRPVEDLSTLANKKLGGVPKMWSLSSLVETLTCKQLPKPKDIRLGNWEMAPLSKAQLGYAATDAFASWYLYEVLMSFLDSS